MTTTRIVIAGHVDHGKSTLVGRLLCDTNQIFVERIEKVKKICEKSAKRFEFAFLLDAFEEEQNQGITIDKTEIPWSYEGQDFLIIDTPGHKEFLKNMISGATTADVALIMLDAAEGVREQFKRHAHIIGMLGIKNIIVVINKMDLVNYDQTHFENLKLKAEALFVDLKIKTPTFIPISAFAGENLLTASALMPWYEAKPLAVSLKELSTAQSKASPNLRFSLQDIYKFDERRIYAGKIESGSLRLGDEISFLPSGSKSIVKSIESWNVTPLPIKAEAGASVGFTLTDPLFLERGDVGFKKAENHPPSLTHQMHASLFWMGKKALEIGRTYRFKMMTQESDCKIESVFNLIHTDSANEKTSEAAEVIIKFQKAIVCDAFLESESTGRFVLLDDHHIVGGGVVLKANTINLSNEAISHVSSSERSARNGHQGGVLWLTGLSGAGKSTIAKRLEQRLFLMNVHSIVLDGDHLRKGLCKDLGFSPEDRKENIRRSAEVAKLIADSGAVAIVALISPFKSDRQLARQLMPEGSFIEVFVNCSLAECEARDTKGLYKKARLGEIRGFTGIDSDYEIPKNPEIEIETTRLDPDASVEKILHYMTTQKLLGQHD